MNSRRNHPPLFRAKPARMAISAAKAEPHTAWCALACFRKDCHEIHCHDHETCRVARIMHITKRRSPPNR
jgi:hypothetical protein